MGFVQNVTILNNLEIKGHPILGDIIIPLSNSKGQPYKYIFLVGENGCGKTTLLKEIAHYQGSGYIKNKQKGVKCAFMPQDIKTQIILDCLQQELANWLLYASTGNRGNFVGKLGMSQHSNSFIPFHGKEVDLVVGKDGKIVDGNGIPVVLGIDLGGGIEYKDGNLSDKYGRLVDNNGEKVLYKDVNLVDKAYQSNRISDVVMKLCSGSNNNKTWAKEFVFNEIKRVLEPLRMLQPTEIKSDSEKTFEDYNRQRFGNSQIPSIEEYSSGEQENLLRLMFLGQNRENVLDSDIIDAIESVQRNKAKLDKRIIAVGGQAADESFANNTGKSQRQTSSTSILLIDEPETGQHPRWQEAFLDLYEAMAKANEGLFFRQIFIATHSEFILQSAVEKMNVAPDDYAIMRFYRDENSKIVVKPITNADLLLPRICFFEVLYTVFRVPTAEYHAQLFGLLQTKSIVDSNGTKHCPTKNRYGKNEFSVSKLDSILANITGCPKPCSKWKNAHNPKDISLCSYIRNQIDHPESQDRETDIRLMDISIEFMRNVIISNT